MTVAGAVRHNPFPGLRPFESEEEHLFFGRETQIDELLGRLRRTRFLAVVGTSGCGKSSLVRAGLLPAINGGLMAGAGSRWRTALLRPGSEPLANLASALTRSPIPHAPSVVNLQNEALDIGLTQAVLARGALGLIEVVAQARLSPGENVLVVVDQFEEIFRFKGSSAERFRVDEAAAFVKLLLAAAADPVRPIYVALTMRSDFLGECAQFRDLPETINDGLFLVPRMTREQLRAAIEGPIGVAKGRISPALVTRLLNDLGDDPDQLPVLQHALMRTWNLWDAHHESVDELDLQYYQQTGGLKHALSLHADEIYAGLSDDRSRVIAERLFKGLTDPGIDKRGIRLPRSFAEACALAGAAPDELRRVVDAFRAPDCSFLMPPAGTPLADDTVLDISHESLMRVWKRLQAWVEAEAQSAQIYRRLAQSAALHAQGETSLMRDPELSTSLRWRDETHPNAVWAARYNPSFDGAMRYLESSDKARAAEKLERSRTRLLQMYGLLAVVAVLLALLAVAAVAYRSAEKAYRSAEIAKTEALRQATKAKKEEGQAKKEENEATKAQKSLVKEVAANKELADARQSTLLDVVRLRQEDIVALKDVRAKAALLKIEHDRAKAAERSAEKASKEASDSAKRALALFRKEKLLVNYNSAADALYKGMTANDEASAILFLGSAIYRKPDLAPAYVLRGSAYDRLGQGNAPESLADDELALADYSSAIRNAGDDAQAYLARGALRERMSTFDAGKSLDDAIEDFEQAIKLRPSNPQAYVQLSYAFQRKGHPEGDNAAVTFFHEVIAQQPENSLPYVQLAAVYRTLGRDKAVADYEQMIDARPAVEMPYQQLAGLFDSSRDFDGAVAEFTKILKTLGQQPAAALAYAERGAAYQSLGDIRSAIDDFTSMIARTRNDPRGYARRGDAYAAAGSLEPALRDYDTALTLDPSDQTLYLRRGNQRAANHDYGGALADYEKVIDIDPLGLGGQAYLQRAAVFDQMRSFDLAIAELERYIKALPSYALTGLVREVADYESAGNAQGVTDTTQRIVERFKGPGYTALANAYMQRGNFDLAIENYKNSGTPSLSQLGIAYTDEGRYDDAIAVLKNLVAASPANSPYYWTLGVAYFDAGQYELADRTLADSARIAPASPYILLWQQLVRYKLGRADPTVFKTSASHVMSNAWPNPVIGLFAGSSSVDSVIGAAQTPGQAYKSAKCEAEFYVGEYLLSRNSVADATSHLTNAKSICSTVDFEYAGSRAELQRLGGQR